MKATFRKVLTSVGAIALAGGALVATSGSAVATPAPYYPDAGATLGGLDFFNAAGVQITSGLTTDSPFVGFAVAQTAPAGGTKATYNAYTPVNGSAPGTWGGAQLGGGTSYPISTPTDLAGLTNPIVTGVSGDTSIANYITTHPNTDTSTTDGYAGLYAIRAKVTGQTGYATADILVTGTTWTQVDGTFQLFADTTTTALAVTPPSPSVPGTVETLTATVADTTAGSTNTPAGTVAFFDGTTQVGTTQTLVGGTAHVTTTFAAGSHVLTAVFTSSAPSIVAGSTSAIPIDWVDPDGTNTALSVNPATAAALTPVDLLATVTDTTTPATHPAGTVSFLDGTTSIGTAPVNGTTGVAEIPAYTGFAQGVHHITAVFSPTGNTVAGSTSADVDFIASTVLCPNGQAQCSDPQTVEATVAAGTITITTPYSPSNPLDLGTLVLNGAGTQLSASAPFGSAPSTFTGASFVSEPGDYIGGGSSFTFSTVTPLTGTPAGFQGFEVSNGTADDFIVEFAAPRGALLVPGTYTDAQRASFRALGHPGLDVFGDGRGCNQVVGSFVVDDATYDASGVVKSFYATFELHCESAAAPPLTGVVSYNSTYGQTGSEIFVTDTRAGDQNWTASVQSGNFTSTSSPTTSIDGQNAGLVGLTVQPVSGNALTAANVTVTNNPSGTAPIISGGTQGIGGAKHTFAQTTAGGDGSVGFTGTFTLNAPTSTGVGLYTGTITFTVG
jgi:hypothetical protein